MMSRAPGNLLRAADESSADDEHALRQVLRLPIAQVRESSGHFVLWAGREAQPGEDVAANSAAFEQWWRDRQTRERQPTP